LKRVKEFWIQSYTSDRSAFAYELISFVFVVSASLYMAMNADNPDMRYIYPGFFLGSVAQIYASWRRGAAWIMLLTTYFSCVNVFGFGRAIGWW
jgi:hypothetical protein